MKRNAAIAGLLMLFAQGAQAQDAGKMLSDGQHFALRHFEDMKDGRGPVGTFAYRIDPKASENAGQWVTILDVTCKEVLEKQAFTMALQTRLSTRHNLPGLTGADWTTLENDILNAMQRLHSLCQPGVSQWQKPKGTQPS